jgi:predicted alpha/beta-hydrolase family hydrolase
MSGANDVPSFPLPIDGASTSVLIERPTGDDAGVVFVCAHGAGGHMRDRNMEKLAHALRSRGVTMVRFNFLYREQGSARPDPMPRLKTCMMAVVEHARNTLQLRNLVIGGRSMGGRTASMLAAESFACDGVLLLAYPLHPAGRPDKLRDAHLSQIAVPVLCLNGTRDALCQRELMERVVSTLGVNWEMHWIQGADHSFHVLKSSGRSDADVLAEVTETSADWISRL